MINVFFLVNEQKNFIVKNNLKGNTKNSHLSRLNLIFYKRMRKNALFSMHELLWTYTFFVLRNQCRTVAREFLTKLLTFTKSFSKKTFFFFFTTSRQKLCQLFDLLRFNSLRQTHVYLFWKAILSFLIDFVWGKKKRRSRNILQFFSLFFWFFLLRWERKKTHEVLKPGSWFVLFLSKCFTIFFHKVKLRQKLPTFQFARFQSVEANTCFFVLHFFWKAILSMQWNCVKS